MHHHNTQHMTFDMDSLNETLSESPVWQSKVDNAKCWKDKALDELILAKYQLGDEVVDQMIEDKWPGNTDPSWKELAEWALTIAYHEEYIVIKELPKLF